jgi:hypothetical protein
MFWHIMSAILREPNVPNPDEIEIRVLHHESRTRWKQSMDTVCVVGCYQLKDHVWIFLNNAEQAH